MYQATLIAFQKNRVRKTVSKCGGKPDVPEDICCSTEILQASIQHKNNCQKSGSEISMDIFRITPMAWYLIIFM
jgi:hypothetical protein